MSSKVSSLEEKVKLPPTETISRCYQPPGKNRKVIRILTVAVYVLCVSLAAIMLSLYYIFIWDPTIRPFVTKGNQCDKIVIPEKIAIRLLNSSEVTAEQFYKHILEQYRILNQLQQQRQQFLQKQHIHLQQLAAANKFQEIFATATIIQANANDPLRKPITPTNGTFLLDPSQPIVNSLEPRIPILDTAQAPIPVLAPASALATAFSSSSSSLSSSSAALAAASATNGHTKRKSHRKHYNNNNHHRHTSRKNHRKSTAVTASGNGNNNADNNNNSNNDYEPEPFVVESPPMNPPILSVVQEPYTQLPIPLVLNSREDKRPLYYTHSERRGGSGGARKRAGYETQTYMNPLLTGELIFEK